MTDLKIVIWISGILDGSLSTWELSEELNLVVKIPQQSKLLKIYKKFCVN